MILAEAAVVAIVGDDGEGDSDGVCGGGNGDNYGGNGGGGEGNNSGGDCGNAGGGEVVITRQTCAAALEAPL